MSASIYTPGDRVMLHYSGELGTVMRAFDAPVMVAGAVCGQVPSLTVAFDKTETRDVSEWSCCRLERSS